MQTDESYYYSLNNQITTVMRILDLREILYVLSLKTIFGHACDSVCIMNNNYYCNVPCSCRIWI